CGVSSGDLQDRYLPPFPYTSLFRSITDADGPLSGVNVLLKNSARGSISDLEGQYSVRAATNDTLVFTYLGYKPIEVPVGSSSTRSEEHTSELQSRENIVCRLLLEKK